MYFCEKTWKKPLTNGIKCSCMSKNKVWLSSLPRLKDCPRPKSWDLLENISPGRVAHSSEECGRCGFHLTKISIWPLITAHKLLDKNTPKRKLFKCQHAFHHLAIYFERNCIFTDTNNWVFKNIILQIIFKTVFDYLQLSLSFTNWFSKVKKTKELCCEEQQT